VSERSAHPGIIFLAKIEKIQGNKFLPNLYAKLLGIMQNSWGSSKA